MNLFNCVVGGIFAASWKQVSKLWRILEEVYFFTYPIEHFFGYCRFFDPNFTVGKLLNIVEKIDHRLKSILKYGVKSNQNGRAADGYQAGIQSFEEALNVQFAEHSSDNESLKNLI